MKKKSIWVYVGKVLIALILIAIISLVGIFVFDRYQASDDLYQNEYEDSYWDELKGFLTYDELKKSEAIYDYTSPEYQSPYNEDDTLLEKINKARYQEELNLLIKELENRAVVVKNEIKDLNKVNASLSREDWIFELVGVMESTDDNELFSKIESDGYTGSENDFNEILENYENINVFKQLVSNGYTNKIKSLMNALLNASNSETLYEEFNENNKYESRKQWILDVCGFNSYKVDEDFSAYDFVLNNGYTGTFEEWKTLLLDVEPYDTISDNYTHPSQSDSDFYWALYKDCGKKDIKNSSAFEIYTVLDEESIATLEKEQNEINELLDVADERDLPTLDEYFNRLEYVTSWGDIIDEETGTQRYSFYFSKGLTTFKIVDNITGYEWYSNPKDVEIKLKEEQNTIVNIIYGTSTGSEILYSNYTYAMTTTDSKGRAVDPNYAINYVKDENGEISKIEVWYGLSKRGINYTYFPQYMKVDHVKKLLQNNKKLAGQKDSSGNTIPDIEASAKNYEEAKKSNDTKTMAENKSGWEAYSKWLETWYQLSTADSAEGKERGYAFYEFKASTFEYMSDLVIEKLYRWLYEWCGYTSSDLKEDNEEFGVVNESHDPSFEVAIVYEFTDDGFKVTVPGNSIREYGDYTICKLDILPYFTSTPEGVDGYTIIPDGSGSILEHDNGKANLYNPYTKRLYTTDLSVSSTTKEAENYDIMLPMYAVVNSNYDSEGNLVGGSSAILVEVGDNDRPDSFNVASQLELRATTSGYGSLGETNNRNYFRAYLRESQKVYIGVYSKDPVSKYTNKLMTEDIVLNYTILGSNDKEYTYSDIAEEYREHLIERYNLQEKDTTTTPVLDLNVIGAYTYEDNFAGISYDAKGTMTTYTELQTMIETYQKLGINYINVFYHGWRKEALVNVTFKKIKLNSLLGTKKQLQALTKNKNVTIYPYVSFGEVNEYQESFGTNHYNTRDVIGEIISKYPYDLSSNTYDTKANKIQIVSPHYYERFAQSLVDSYVKLFGSKTASDNKIGINSISIDKFGSALAGDYKKNNELFKTSAIRNQLKSLELISEQIENINLYQPYDYAFQYISYAKDIPYKSTQKEILDYSIPFYQLVVNGLFDYSGESINVNIEEGIDYHIMKLIETGSNPSFTFTYDSSSELIRTDYNNYYNTEYSNWIEEVKTFYNILNNLGIYNCRLTAHEKLDTNVYKVTYSNGSEQIQIILNYSFSSINIDGIGTISAKSYKVL